MYKPNAFQVSEGLAKIKKARSQFFSAKAALAVGNRVDAEQHARTSIRLYASAMNWLEEGADGFDLAHTEIHEVGLFCRQEFPFGCQVEKHGSDFMERCPLPLAHNRFGFSPSMTGNAICSICNADITECSHRPGEEYSIEAQRHPGGHCNICGDKHCTTHDVGVLCTARAIVIISKIYEIEEISLVNRPRNPDARIIASSLSRDQIERALGEHVPATGYLQCDKCLIPCQGLNYLPDSKVHDTEK